MLHSLTLSALIFEAEGPMRIFTVSGRSMPSAMPATSRCSLAGLLGVNENVSYFEDRFLSKVQTLQM